MALASPPSIEKLRAFEADSAFRPTLTQLRCVVDGLIAMRTLTAISADAGLDSDRVLQVVSDLGSWLAKSKGGFKGEIAYAADLAEMPLPLQLPRPSTVKATTPPRRTRKRPPFSGVVIPPGFEQRSSGRDLDKSLASIVYHKPSDEVLMRFCARTYAAQPKELTHSVVAAVHLFARMERLGELTPAEEAEFVANVGAARSQLARARRLKSKVTARVARQERWLSFAEAADVRAKARLDEAKYLLWLAKHWHLATLVTADDARAYTAKTQELGPLAALLVQAYDLLEIARQDAFAAVATILKSRDLDVLRDAVVKLRVLDEPAAKRLERMVDLVTARPESISMLEREIRFFTKCVVAAPEHFCPESVAELTPPQVKRICANAGLRVEADVEERAFEQSLRDRLRELVLDADSDRLVPAGLRAFRNGRAAEFFEALTKRAEGDPTWVDDMEDLVRSEELVGA